MPSNNSEHVMRTYLESVVRDGQLELIHSFVGNDFVDHTQPKLRGPAALEAHVRSFRENIPDVSVTIDQIIATDDAAVGIWRWSGTPRTAMAVSASGGPVNPRHAASVFRFRNGLLVEYRVFADVVDVFSQLTDRGGAD